MLSDTERNLINGLDSDTLRTIAQSSPGQWTILDRSVQGSTGFSVGLVENANDPGAGPLAVDGDILFDPGVQIVNGVTFTPEWLWNTVVASRDEANAKPAELAAAASQVLAQRAAQPAPQPTSQGIPLRNPLEVRELLQQLVYATGTPRPNELAAALLATMQAQGLMVPEGL